MKRLAFLFILIQCKICLAQKYLERPALLEVGYGVSVPFGKYESVDVSDSASGYATAGSSLNFMFVYLVNKNFGVAAMINSTSNRLNTEGVRNKFNRYLDEHINGAIISDLHLEKWHTIGYVAGGYVTVPLQKASFNLQLMAGYSRSKYPEADVVAFKDTSFDAISITQSSAEIASAFCLDAGVGLKYNISDIMCLSVNANFFSTYPAFEKVVTTSTYQGNTPDEIHKVHQRISQLNVTAGIGFRF